MGTSLTAIRSPPSWTARFSCRSRSPPPSSFVNLARRSGSGDVAGARAVRTLITRRRGVGGSGEEEGVRTLLIDNYDSYTYNIYQELSVVNGVPPVVIQNDEWIWDDICYSLFEEKAFDNIVISPGPGSPTCPVDIGICLQVLQECKDIPILGICLGHQALGVVHGAQIVHAPEPVHGRLSEIEHSGCNLFGDIPSGRKSGFKVVRYHSLIIDARSLPKELIPVAWTSSLNIQSFLETQKSDTILGAFENHTNQFQSVNHFFDEIKIKGLARPSTFNDLENTNILMGVMHSSRPHYGVQFHPESIATSYGRQIFKNFKKITVDYQPKSSRLLHERKVCHSSESYKEFPKRGLFDSKVTGQPLAINKDSMLPITNVDGRYLMLQWKKIDGLVSQVDGAASIFCELFEDMNARDTFWLDSSSTDQGRARFSFMGGRGGPLWKQITFKLSDKSELSGKIGGYLSILDSLGSVKTTFLKEGFLDFLNKELQSFHYDKQDYEELPFDFCGGFIGFIGEKDQAENLMIVDLLRNDLGRVCEPGSVCVPRLMEVESYATVHTMVSTIQGRRKPNISPVDCVRAAFPGGSMTGAPKLRSMELLDSLESSSRGIYSGSIGFFSYNQRFDLNIVIRTVVIHNGEASVGAGGAIVALSNPEAEYAEMLLKAKVPTKVVEDYTTEPEPGHCGTTLNLAA